MLDRGKLTNDLLTMSGNAGLVLADFQVRGRAHTPQSQLLAKLNLQIGAPILGIDLQKPVSYTHLTLPTKRIV